jgi:Circularly permutated YpsA SLOG family
LVYSSSILSGMGLVKIVSGGQTGVDRAALDAALVAGFPCGGWCPAGRLAEDGEIPERYPLTELPADEHALGTRTTRQVAEGYRARTLKNLQDSDGMVILFSGTLSGGTLLTRNLCVREKKPFIALDSRQISALRTADTILRFLEEQAVDVLNVAGPRASGWPEGYAFSLRVIGEVISRT